MEEKTHDDALLRGIFGAFSRAIDVGVLRAELLRCVQGAGLDASAPGVESAHGVQSVSTSEGEGGQGMASGLKEDLLRRVVLADVLDESILAARPGDKSFPLRLLFGALGGALADDAAFALASGMNFYFRASIDEEIKMRLGVEVSRLYYRFAATHLSEPGVTAQTSPLLAALMNGELTRVRFESVDHMGVFDSSVHEREPDADVQSSALVRPSTFLCRVAKSTVVRARAMVIT